MLMVGGKRDAVCRIGVRVNGERRDGRSSRRMSKTRVEATCACRSGRQIMAAFLLTSKVIAHANDHNAWDNNKQLGAKKAIPATRIFCGS
jgi:hypothetical protein